MGNRQRFMTGMALALGAASSLYAASPLPAPAQALSTPAAVGKTPSQPVQAPRVLNMKEMDVYQGIDPAKIDNFWEKWRQVTVRYRADVDEERFVYANDIAWKAIVAGKQEFPQGSMFGKVAFMMGADPAFPNSMIPKMFSRIQVMSKNKKKYPNSAGWGYAIWPPGRRDGNVEGVVEACHACHTLVSKRDYVFSEPAFFFLPAQKARDFEMVYHDRFEKKAIDDLTEFQKKAVKAHLTEPLPKEIKVYSMPLFNGSLSESVGPLAKYVGSEDLPYLLVDDKRERFLLAVRQPKSDDCEKPVRTVSYVKGAGPPVLRMDDAAANAGRQDPAVERKFLVTNILCDGKVIHTDFYRPPTPAPSPSPSTSK